MNFNNNIRLFDGDQIIISKSKNPILDQLSLAIRSNINPKFLNIYVGGRLENPGTIKVASGSTLNTAILLGGGKKFISGKVTFIRYQSDGKLDRRVIRYNKSAMQGSYNNPFLEDFYENSKKNALPLELFFLAERYELLKINSENMFFSGTVSDFVFDKSKLFAANTLKEYELTIFNKIFSLMKKSVKNPDILIYLHTDYSSLQNKIAKRGREYERSIQLDYLKKLNDSYFDYINKSLNFPTVLIDVTHLDFKNNPSDYKLVKKIIFQKHKNGVTKFNPSN